VLKIVKGERIIMKKIKVCLVGSSGGHLTHLYMLKPFWNNKERFWVTFDKEDARSLLKNEKMYPCYYPSNRSLKALAINTWKAIRILLKEKPDLIISSGAAPAIPFFLDWEDVRYKNDLY
jgi:UDP-N-acetylglucosamine:LPS N-acetylglucosamine transferase